MARRMQKKKQQMIAQKRIEKLFSFADRQAKAGKLQYADNVVLIARRIAMKTTFRLPKDYKHRFCKHCYHYFLPSVTCRVRIQHGKKTITCYHCHRQTRIPYKPLQ